MKTPETNRKRRQRVPGKRWQRRLVHRYRTNIAAFLFSQCTQTDWLYGVQFYPRMNAWCVERAADYNVSVECVAGVVSALSPNNPFKSNMTNAEGLIFAWTNGRTPEEVRVSTYGQNKRRAFRVLNEGTAAPVRTSQKTAAFIDNIINPHGEAVTVDVHAYSVAHARRFTTKVMPNIPAWKYRLIARAFHQVGAWFGLKGVDIQSVTWIAWKRVHRINYDVGMWLDQLRLPYNHVFNSGRQAMTTTVPAHAAHALKAVSQVSRTFTPPPRKEGKECRSLQLNK